MLSFAARGSGLAQYVKASSQAVGSKVLGPAAVVEEHNIAPPPKQSLTAYSMAHNLPTGKLTAVSGAVGSKLCKLSYKMNLMGKLSFLISNESDPLVTH